MAFEKNNSQIRCGEILVSDNNTDYAILCIFCQKNFQTFDCFVEHRISCVSTMTGGFSEDNISIKIEDIGYLDDNENTGDSHLHSKLCEDTNNVSAIKAVENNNVNVQEHLCPTYNGNTLDKKLDKMNGALDNINNEVSGLHLKYDQLINILTQILPQTQPFIQNVTGNSIDCNNHSNNEDDFDHLQQKSTIDENVIDVGFSTLKSEDIVENGKEIANDSEKFTKRMPQKRAIKYTTNDWEIFRQFNSKLDAENYLKIDWAKHASYKSCKGTRDYYRCNKLKFRGPQCDAKMFITYDVESPDVYIYSNNKDHTHRQLKNKRTSICPRMKNDIIELASLKLTPRAILKRLYPKYSNEKLIIPNVVQISSFLKRRKTKVLEIKNDSEDFTGRMPRKR